jgi:alkylation response protein AidB-like acyl-CoA dehydrogenase
MVDMVAKARAIADDVLFPAASEVDLTGEIPQSHFALLAAEGFYGLAAPAEFGGPELTLPEFAAILESFAGGCLATTFTWMQHHGLVRGLVGTTRADLRAKYLAPALRGEIRGGVAFAGAIPKPPRLWATKTEGGHLLSGEGPFVSGWGLVDVLQLSSRLTDEAGETIVSGIIDAVAGETLTAEALDLIAARGTKTVRLRFDDYFLPDAQVVGEVSHAGFLAGQSLGSRLNACVPLGVAGRCVRLIEEAGQAKTAASLADRQAEVRGSLDAAMADSSLLPSARAEASELAFRAAGALVATAGSSAVLSGHHGERLVREAAFTLVAASRPEMKSGIQGLLSRWP